MTSIGKSILWIIFCAALAAVFGVYLLCRDHSDYFRSRKGNLASVDISQPAPEQLLIRHELSLRSDSGLTVKAALLTPGKKVPGRRHPAVVMLAGLETGAHAVRYIRDTGNLIIAALDYPYPKRELNTAAKVAAEIIPLRKAALDTVASVMLLIDYLSRRPDVDAARITVVGFSLGAVFVPCIAVEDRRAEAAVMVYGGGDLREIVKHNVRRFSSERQSDLLGYAAGLLLRPIEPMRYADRVSPTPLLMINGTSDALIPRQCTENFFRIARSPKKLVWLESRHITPDNKGLINRIIATLQKELSDLHR